MDFDGDPQAGSNKSELKQLLRHALSVFERKREERVQKSPSDDVYSGLLSRWSESSGPATSASRRQVYDDALLALLRLVLESHPQVEQERIGTVAPAKEDSELHFRDAKLAKDQKADRLAVALSKLLSLVDMRRRLLPELSTYDESWALLLSTVLAERRGHGISVSELCRQIGCALATGQRRVDRMEQLGLLDRAPDPDDLRRHGVFPTDKGRKAAEDYAAAVGRDGFVNL